MHVGVGVCEGAAGAGCGLLSDSGSDAKVNALSTSVLQCVAVCCSLLQCAAGFFQIQVQMPK